MDDGLTGEVAVSSREYFLLRCDSHLELLRRRARNNRDLKSTVVVLELAGTRELIARCGWPVREYLAGAFAVAIKRVIRAYDILGRWDGESFVILFMDCDADEAEQTVKRIRGELDSGEHLFCGERLRPQFRAGLACFSDCAILPDSARELVGLAERRMRDAGGIPN